MTKVNQQLIAGKDCQGKVRALFRRNKWNNVLLVTGKKSFETSGAEQFVDTCFADMNVSAIRFCGFDNNPNISDLKKGLDLTKELDLSIIIAIGGGSVLDMGKLIRFFLTHDGEILSDKYRENEIDIPMIAVPTTAGTGAEATHFSVLYDEQGKKHSIAEERILPDFAVIYPELTYNQSPYITACTGFDALAQAIEAYWNKNATPESDEYALKALNLIFDTLPEVVKKPTEELRRKMAEGAYWAGRAINITKTTAPHAFSYPFTSKYGIPHGHAVALAFPPLARFNFRNGNLSASKKTFLEELFFSNKPNLDSLEEYIEKLGLSIPSRNYEIETLVNGINLERLANNPAEIPKSVAVEIIKGIITRNL